MKGFLFEDEKQSVSNLYKICNTILKQKKNKVALLKKYKTEIAMMSAMCEVNLINRKKHKLMYMLGVTRSIENMIKAAAVRCKDTFCKERKAAF